jgi:2-amino-4-hydroxy-6-hydroxymethyldihydropteridine diphosphokinase
VRAPEDAWIALGTNLGARARYLAVGRAGLAALPASRLVAVSRIEETDPIGPPGQGAYLNQMALVTTRLDPHDLLDALLAIEGAAGRRRRERWGPRTLDLDIVRFGSRSVTTARLTLPHPALPQRSFWQRALEELARHVR